MKVWVGTADSVMLSRSHEGCQVDDCACSEEEGGQS